MSVLLCTRYVPVPNLLHAGRQKVLVEWPVLLFRLRVNESENFGPDIFYSYFSKFSLVPSGKRQDSSLL